MRKCAWLLVALLVPLAACQSTTTGHGTAAAGSSTSASATAWPPSGLPSSSQPTPSHSLGGGSPAPSSRPRRPKPSATAKKSPPATVVTAYISAINRHAYATAWAIYHLAARGQSYSSFVSGFRDTDHDQLTITGSSGSTVHIDLIAFQTDGSKRHFTGTYTVRGARITAAHLSAAH